MPPLPSFEAWVPLRLDLCLSHSVTSLLPAQSPAGPGHTSTPAVPPTGRPHYLWKSCFSFKAQLLCPLLGNLPSSPASCQGSYFLLSLKERCLKAGGRTCGPTPHPPPPALPESQGAGRALGDPLVTHLHSPDDGFCCPGLWHWTGGLSLPTLIHCPSSLASRTPLLPGFAFQLSGGSFLVPSAAASSSLPPRPVSIPGPVLRCLPVCSPSDLVL